MIKRVGGTVKKSVGEYYSAYINDLIESGRYHTVAEVLREALRLHEDKHLNKYRSENDKHF